MKTNTEKDFSGQVQSVLVSTSGAASDYAVKTIVSDRTGDSLRKTLPPTPLSERKRSK